jgi:hypothetical protein
MTSLPPADRPLEPNALARILARGLFKVVNKLLLGVRSLGIVLDVLVSSITFDGLMRVTLIEHEVVEK